MTKARKQHECTLCHRTILAGENYIRETITPWSHPDNESFGTYKAHGLCDAEWMGGLGESLDWIFPADKYEWRER